METSNTITSTVIPSQTIESFIRENGGVIKFHKDYTLAYGLSRHAVYLAIQVAFKQHYKVLCDKDDPINSFRYWKEGK